MGLGVAMIAVPYVDRHLESGALQRLLPDWYADLGAIIALLRQSKIAAHQNPCLRGSCDPRVPRTQSGPAIFSRRMIEPCQMMTATGHHAIRRDGTPTTGLPLGRNVHVDRHLGRFPKHDAKNLAALPRREHLASKPSCFSPGDFPKPHSGEQAVAGKIARGALARKADFRSATDEEIQDFRAVRPQNASPRVDAQATLSVKDSAGNAYRAKGEPAARRRESPCRSGHGPLHASAPRPRPRPRRKCGERRRRQAKRFRKPKDILKLQDRALRLGDAVVPRTGRQSPRCGHGRLSRPCPRAGRARSRPVRNNHGFRRRSAAPALT